MKILVISESDVTLKSYSDFFSSNGFETICYSWLLKALDNITEIKPDIVLINSIDYPRHWKTLVQYIRSMHEYVSKIILVVPREVETEEQKKIDALNVFCVEEDFYSSEQSENVILAITESKVHTFENNELGEIAPSSESDIFDTSEPTEEIDISENAMDFIQVDLESEIEEEDEELDISEHTLVIDEDSNEPEIILEHELVKEDHFEEISEVTQSPSIKEAEVTLSEQEDTVITEDIATQDSAEELYFDESAIEEDIFDDDIFEDEIFEEDIFEDQSDNEMASGMWLTCPISQSDETVTGQVLKYEHPIIVFTPNDRTKISLFSFGKKIESCTLLDDGFPSTIMVQVQGFENDSIELCVVK